MHLSHTTNIQSVSNDELRVSLHLDRSRLLNTVDVV